MPEPRWRAYERQIFDALTASVSEDSTVEFDQNLPGRFSEIDRQIDVVIRGTFAGLPHTHLGIVDCKCFARKLDVTDVNGFIGLVLDINPDFALMIAPKGFTESASRRAAASRIVLNVVELDELAYWLPIRPAVAITAGSSTATLTYFDKRGAVRTEIVSVELAQQVLEASKSDRREGTNG